MSGCCYLKLISLLLFVPLLVKSQLQCSKGLVSVRRNGSLSFLPLSPGSEDTTSSYDPGVIGGWYSLSSGFIETVRSGSLPYDAIKNGLQSLNVPCTVAGLRNDCTSGRTLTTSMFDPNELLESFIGWFAGIIAVTILGGLLGFSFLICGCCFWCCRFCGNCRGDETKISPNTDYKLLAFSIILLLFILLLLVGVILAFFSNEQTFRSLENFQDNIHVVTETGATFLNDTLTEVEELLCQLTAPEDGAVSIVLDEVKGFSTALQSELNKIGDEVFAVLDTLSSLPAGFILTIDVLSSISNNTVALAASFGELLTTLDNIRTGIETLLLNCTSGEVDEEVCGMIPSSSHIDTDANYSSLPDISSQLLAVRQALEDLNLSELVDEGRQSFDNVSLSITTSIAEGLDNVTGELQNAIDSVRDAVGSATSFVRAFLVSNQSRTDCPPIDDGSVFRDLEDNINKIRSDTVRSRQVLNVGYVQQCIIDQGFDYIQQYDAYRYGFGIAICSISLVTILFVLVGVVLGLIGFKRRVSPSERTLLSHCGGLLLLIGVSVTFLIGFLVMILSAVMFFFGASAQKLCLAMEGPGYPLFSEVIDDQEFWGGSLGGQVFRAVNPDATDAVLSVAAALRNCERNEALFSAFNLSNLLSTGSVGMQVQTMANLSEVGVMVDGLVNEAADSFNFTNTSFLPMKAQTALTRYVEANVQDINITEFEDELNRTLLSFNVSETIDVFTNISDQLSDPTGATGQASTRDQQQMIVDDIIADLRRVENLVPIIIELVVRLSSDIQDLEEVIETTVLTTSLVVARVDSLIDNITGDTLVRFLDNTVVVTIERTVGYIRAYVDHLENMVTKHVARCQPLWSIYTATYNSVCGVFLDGLNGFWWSLGFCSILFIPVIIFSVITSTCYLRRKSEETAYSQTLHPMQTFPNDQEKSSEVSL